MIRIVDWDRHQHYKGKSGPPLWVKLYRDILTNYHISEEMDDHERWVLIGLWCLAARHENEIPHSTGYLTRALATDVTEDDLSHLKACGFIELQDSRESLDPDSRLRREEKRREEKRRNNPPVPPHDVENSRNGDAGKAAWLAVSESATRELGLGRLSYKQEQQNRSIIISWRDKERRDPNDALAAVRGAAMLRDEDVGWLNRGEPYTLACLYNTKTLHDMGDGNVNRPLWAVAMERARQPPKGPGYKKRGGMDAIANVLHDISQGAA